MKPANCCAVSCAINLPGFSSAREVAAQLLGELGVHIAITDDADPAPQAWRRAGLLPLCGDAEGSPWMPPVPLAASADGAMLALRVLADDPDQLPLNGALLLGERARMMGLRRAGRHSTGGHCRLLDTKDGRLALNLARADDWGLMEAWLGEPASSWAAIERLAIVRETQGLIDRGVDLGLPIGQDRIAPSRPWCDRVRFAARRGCGCGEKAPLVVDLSSLWAGPLAGNLLELLGADVVKVESTTRPDGARQGHSAFFDLLNGGKPSVMLDFGSDQGRADLQKLIAAADIVIEASRPRALRQLGLHAEQLVAAKPGKIWLRLLAHGDEEQRVGFGDDIGVSAGLCTVMEQAWGRPCFVGDAIADPISGIYAALAAWAAWQQGGGMLLTLSMVDAVRHAAQMDRLPDDLASLAGTWQEEGEADNSALYPLRAARAIAEEPGASTASIMERLC